MQGATFNPNRTGEFCEKPAFVKKRIREMASNRIVIFVIGPELLIPLMVVFNKITLFIPASGCPS
jgi:hypothetical protein